MGAQLQIALPGEALSQKGRSLQKVADNLLKGAVWFWFAVMVIGQFIFAFAVASFYGIAAVRGRSAAAWSSHITHGFVPGDVLGNFAVAIHLSSAPVIILAGLMQLIPQIRRRAPWLHRWNGRLYIVTAFSISLAGLYMTWVRGSVGDFVQHVGSSLMAVLIMVFAAMALRFAMAGDFRTHRRWALRLYLVVSASLFIRAGLFLSFVLNHGAYGFDATTFTGPFLTFITFAQYLVPLGVLEIYFLAQDRGGAPARFAMATGLAALTLALGVGIFAVTAAGWLPEIRKAYDKRTPIEEVLSATIASNGLDGARKQYHYLKVAAASTYNFDEGELNTLGYELLHANKFKEAIGILQLNADVYPQSSNVYDSLGEAYMNAGDKTLAIANYQKSLQLNPKNTNAVNMLQKLNGR